MGRISLCLGTVLALTLAGCGGKKVETPKTTSAAPTEKAIGAGSPTFPPPPPGGPGSKQP